LTPTITYPRTKPEVDRMIDCWVMAVWSSSRKTIPGTEVGRRSVGPQYYTDLIYFLPYLAADCQLVSDEGRRQLRSANSRTCVVRRTYSSYGDRRFVATKVLGCGTVCQLIW